MTYTSKMSKGGMEWNGMEWNDYLFKVVLGLIPGVKSLAMTGLPGFAEPADNIPQ